MRLSAVPQTPFPAALPALRRTSLASGVLVVLIGVAPAGARAAEDDDSEAAASSSTPISIYRIGLNGSPRITRVDLAVGTPSAGFAGMPALRPDSARLSDISYRFWVSRGRADLGIGIGTMALTAQPMGTAPSAAPGAASDNPSIVLASAPALSVGMRFRASPQSTVFADASGIRGLGANNGDAYLGKVGVEWKPTSFASRWNIAYGGIGWRLNADSRMTLRIRRGGLGLYMRSQF